MQITRYTDYSLRVLIYLAVNPEEKCTISAIADSYDISKNHLMKIVQDLNNRGYLLATRGKNGGVQLKDAPEDISIGKLVRALENKSKIIECFGDNNQCVITPHCKLKMVFAKAVDSFYKTLDTFTLADLVGQEDKNPLAQLLAIELPTAS